MSNESQNPNLPTPPNARRRRKIAQLEDSTSDTQNSESLQSSSPGQELRRRRSSLNLRNRSLNEDEYQQNPDIQNGEETAVNQSRGPPIADGMSNSSEISSALPKRRSLRQLQSVDCFSKPETTDIHRHKLQTTNLQMVSNQSSTKETHISQFNRIQLTSSTESGPIEEAPA